MPRKQEYKVKPEQVTKVINDYLTECYAKKKVPFMIEVAHLLGISKDTLTGYLQKPAYADAIKKLKESTELSLQKKIIDEGKPVGGIFLLKALFGYVEANKLDVTSNGETLGVIALPPRK